MEWQLPYYPNYRLFFRETPPPPLKLNLNGNYPYYPNYRLFFILWVYNIWVSTPIESIVLSLFLAFLTSPTFTFLTSGV